MSRIINETVATLENLKMRVVLGRVESDLEIEDTLQDAIDSIRTTQLHTAPQQVHGVPTIEELVSVIEGSSGFVHQTDVHKLATKIHTMLLNRHEGRS